MVADEAGIEPTTPGLEGRCSIQLSYSPVERMSERRKPARETLSAAEDVASLIVMATAARKIASQAWRAAAESTPQPAA